jgi:hypothetical protein
VQIDRSQVGDEFVGDHFSSNRTGVQRLHFGQRALIQRLPEVS